MANASSVADGYANGVQMASKFASQVISLLISLPRIGLIHMILCKHVLSPSTLHM